MGEFLDRPAYPCRNLSCNFIMMVLNTRSSKERVVSHKHHKFRSKGVHQVQLGPPAVTNRRVRTHTDLRDNDEDIFLHYYPLAKTQQNRLSSPVVVGRQPCEPHNLTLLSLGGGSHLKRESHPFPVGLVFWGDWAFSRVDAPECGAKIVETQQETLVAL